MALTPAKTPAKIDHIKILARRQQLGLKQAEVARRAGLTPSRWSRLESGMYNPGPKVAPRVAKALRCPLKRLQA
jgi:transcriptional regulator with XRE-family HTH domain